MTTLKRPGRANTKPAARSATVKRTADKHLTEGREPHHARAAGLAVCPECQAVWERKRWHLVEPAYARLIAAAGAEVKSCPACVKIAGRHYDAHLILEGLANNDHRKEIVSLMLSLERDLRQDNPLLRLAAVVPGEASMEIWTVGTFLAERIGRAIERTYGGELTIHPDRGEGPMQIHWTSPR